MQLGATFEHWLAQARTHALSVFSSVEPVKPTRPIYSWLGDKWLGDNWLGDNKWLGARLDHVPKYLWLAIWPLALLAILFYLKGESGELVRYRVRSPKAPDKEETLKNPTVKVCSCTRTWRCGQIL